MAIAEFAFFLKIILENIVFPFIFKLFILSLITFFIRNLLSYYILENIHVHILKTILLNKNQVVETIYVIPAIVIIV